MVPSYSVSMTTFGDWIRFLPRVIIQSCRHFPALSIGTDCTSEIRILGEGNYISSDKAFHQVVMEIKKIKNKSQNLKPAQKSLEVHRGNLPNHPPKTHSIC